jgi:hypothetical protein
MEEAIEIADPEPCLITKAATQLDVKGTASRLNRKPTYIYRMGDDPEEDRYGRFLQLYYAVPDAGAEIFFQDFVLRHKERMLREKSAAEVGPAEGIGDFMRASAKFFSALVNRDGDQITKEGNKLLQVLGTLMSFGRKLQNGEAGRKSRAIETP